MFNNPNLFPFVFIPIAGLFILELIFLFTWVPFYFRNGIPLLSKNYPIPLMFNLGPHVETLENALKHGFFRPSVVFKSFNNNEFGFRNKASSRTLVSGFIRIEPNNGRITIIGNLPWVYPLAIFMGILISIIYAQFLIFVGYFIISGWAIFIQWRINISIEKIISDTLKNEGLLLDDPFENS